MDQPALDKARLTRYLSECKGARRVIFHTTSEQTILDVSDRQKDGSFKRIQSITAESVTKALDLLIPARRR